MPLFMGNDGAVGASGLSPSRLSSRRRLSPIAKGNTSYFSMARFRYLEMQLAALITEAAEAEGVEKPSSGGGKKRDERLIEIIRAIAELVAFGEASRDPDFFEFFCEKTIMASFVRLLRLGPAIQTQIVQAISILFQNLQSPSSLYMLLSQDHINRLIEPEADVGAELPLWNEEFVSNYVALLKAISVRLSKDTVQFFLNAEMGSFPLYFQAVPLITHADPMVRTSALNIVLHVISVDDPGVTAFLDLEENRRSFFTELARLMQDTYSQVLCRVWRAREPSVEPVGMEGATSVLQDMLYYIQDALDASDPRMAERLAVHLYDAFLRPVILQRLAAAFDHKTGCGGGGGEGEEASVMSAEQEPEIQLALYALCQFFLVTSHRTLVTLVARDLLGDDGTLSRNDTICPAHGPLKQAATKVDVDDGLRRRDVGVGVEAEAASGEVEVEYKTENIWPGLSSGGESAVAGKGSGNGIAGAAGGCCCYRYRRGLLSCMAQREVGQIRLGAIAVVRCLIRNSVLQSGSVVASKAITAPGDAEVPGPEAVAASFAHQASLAALSGGATNAVTGCLCSSCASAGAVVGPLATDVTIARGTLVEAGEKVGSGRSSEGLPSSGEEFVACGVCEGGYGNAVSNVGDRTGTSVGLEGLVESSKDVAAPELPRQVQALRGGGEERCGRDDGFEQVMKSLLLTLGVHPVSRTIELRTAAAAVEELEGLWNVVSAERRSCAACGVTRNCCIGDTCAGGGASLGAWSVGSGSRNRRFAVMLEEGYAASAAVLLRVTTRLHPFALLFAFEQAVAPVRVGIGVGVERETGEARGLPLPQLAKVTGWESLLVPDKQEGRRLSSVLRGSGSAGDTTVACVQAYLVLRYLHERLVKGKWSPPQSPTKNTREISGVIRVGADILALTGNADPYRPATGQRTALTTAEEKGQLRIAGAAPSTASPTGSLVSESAVAGLLPVPLGTARGEELALPRAARRVTLSRKRCLACSLPQNWPGLALEFATATAAPRRAPSTGGEGTRELESRGQRHIQLIGAAAPGREGEVGAEAAVAVAVAVGSVVVSPHPTTLRVATTTPTQRHRRHLSHQHSSLLPSPTSPQSPSAKHSPRPPRGLYAVFDECSFVLAAPDPSSTEDARIVCSAPLRHTTARPHPADARVIELRVSTIEDGCTGPGLFLPIASPAAPWLGDDRASGASFRGPDYRGVWHLVLVFESAAACLQVVEHVEEQREAVLAARTVGLVEILRSTTGLVRNRSDSLH